MRPSILLVVIALTAGAPVRAQVTLDLNALDALPQPTPGPARHAVRVIHRPRRLVAAMPVLPVPPTPPAAELAASAPAATARTVAPGAPAAVVASSTHATPAAPPSPPHATPAAAAPAPAATVPLAPPAEVALGPLIPAAPSAAPPPVAPVVAGAAGAATPTRAGLTITFGADQSDLNAASDGAIRKLAASAPKSDATTFNVLAFAHGDAQDPSTARRLSLARALAIRSALMAAGVPSTRVYLRALGAAGGKGPADRADITVMGLDAPAATAAATSGAPATGKEE